MRFLKLIVSLLVLFSCGQNEAELQRRYYRGEVNKRIDLLRELKTPDTSVAKSLHAEIEKVILVSKDAENAPAARSMANSLFDKYAGRYQFKRADFPAAAAEASLDEIELQLRENELGMLDRIIMAAAPDSAHLFTAH